MSRADIDRFLRDMKTSTDLQQAVTRGAGGLQSVVDIANQRGYQITIDEARQYMRDQAANLSDAELDALAGGKGSPPPPHVSPPIVITGPTPVVITGPAIIVVEVVAT